MGTKKAFIKGVGIHSYKLNEVAEIIGVVMVTPEGLKERPCFEVLYQDGFINYIAMSDVEEGNYKIIPDPSVRVEDVTITTPIISATSLSL